MLLNNLEEASVIQASELGQVMHISNDLAQFNLAGGEIVFFWILLLAQGIHLLCFLLDVLCDFR